MAGKFLSGLGRLASALVLVFAAFAVYGYLAEGSARKRALAMCTSITIGESSETLRDRAIADWASEAHSRWVKLDGLDTLFITYVGLPPYSRHICLVQARDGRVISVRQRHLD